jgi:hypothetical protein
MGSTIVNLTKMKRGKGAVYQIDYRINRKGIREVAGPVQVKPQSILA